MSGVAFWFATDALQKSAHLDIMMYRANIIGAMSMLVPVDGAMHQSLQCSTRMLWVSLK